MPQPGTANDLKDGFIQIVGGTNSSVAPTDLDRTSTAWMVNCTARGQFLKPRPGWRRLTVGGAIPFFNQVRFQGAAFYRSESGDNGITCMIDGRLYLLRPSGAHKFSNTEITPTEGSNSPNLKQAFFCQGENFMIVQDTLASPIIFDGGGARRAGQGEITSGAMGTYHNGRIWYATPNRKNYRATDLVRGSSGTSAYNYRDSILKITENNFLNGGGDFSIPDSNDEITAMAVPAKLDVASGEGNLQVLTQNEVIRITAPVDRTSWQDVTSPLATMGQVNNGGTGPANLVVANGDLLYRSEDGVRSYILANREFNQTWANTPISDEISRLLDDDNPYFLKYGSAVVWSNYVLFTALPRWTAYGYVHSALAVLNLDTLNTMSEKSNPVWEGMWNGGDFLQLITGDFAGRKRLLAFVLNGNEQLELWELDAGLEDDQDGAGNGHAFPWAFETFSFFKDNLFDLKQLRWGQLTLDEIAGGVTGEVKYKPDADSQWSSWATFGTTQTMSDDMGSTPPNIGEGSRRRITLGSPADGCGAEANVRTFYEAQLRFELAGKARVRRFRATATPRTESTTAEDCSSQTKLRNRSTSGSAETYLMPAAYPT